MRIYIDGWMNFKMESNEIQKKIDIIYDDEKDNHTCKYEKIRGLKGKVQGGIEPLIAKNPNDYVFKSENVELLLKLHARCKDTMEKEVFFSMLLSTFKFKDYHGVAYLSFQTLIRMQKLNMAVKHLFASFTDFDQDKDLLSCFGMLGQSLKYESYLYSGSTLDFLKEHLHYAHLVIKKHIRENPFITPESALMDREDFLQIFEGVQQQVKKIMHLRLKEELEEVDVTEINQDKVKVQQLLKESNFSEGLQESLDRFDGEYKKAKDKFDYKNCIGHVRSFLENLGKEIIPKIEPFVNDKFKGDITRAKDVRNYLKKIGFLGENQYSLYASLFGLSSNEGVHPLSANKENARLCKNMSIEYSLLLLQRVDSFK